VQRARFGVPVVAGLVAAQALAWLLFPPSGPARQVAAELSAATTVLLFATALVLATRWRWLEPFFGGLDRMYRAHRRAALAGFALLIVHVAVVPWTLRSPGGTPSGLIAFVGLVVLVALSVGPRVPGLRRLVTLGYGAWRRSHRLVGVFFLISLAHALLVDQVVMTSPVPFALLLAAYVAGALAYLYVMLVAWLVRPTFRYTVQGARRLNPHTVELALAPAGKRPLMFRAGQFVFVRIRQRGLREPHPFTVSSAPTEDRLRLTIKAGGDFTRRLYEEATVGAKVTVEGAYGLLDHRTGGERQIWIAGGIGITPFLSRMRAADAATRRVDLYYSVRHAGDVLFRDEIQRSLGARAHVHVSSVDGPLTVARLAEAHPDLREAHVYLCGPAAMIRAFERDLRRLGVPAARIHFEEFAFR
jgi:predicted ferric reductase